MRIVAHSEYNLGDNVDYTYNYPKTKMGVGVIREVQFAKQQGKIEGSVWITYLIEPDDMIGFEHDEYYHIHETSILGKAD